MAETIQPASEVQRLADQLVEAVGVVRAQAENEIGDFYRAASHEREAMQALRRLERLAGRFQSDVPETPAAREDFDRLVHAYEHAANLVEQLREHPAVYRSFYPVHQLMDRLATHYDYDLSRPSN
jgi:hypothetical protein